MISAPRIVVVSVIFFPMGLFYYSSANGADYAINTRNPAVASIGAATCVVVSLVSRAAWRLIEGVFRMSAKTSDESKP